MRLQTGRLVALMVCLVVAVHLSPFCLSAQESDESEILVPVPIVDAAFADYLDSEIRTAAAQPRQPGGQPPAAVSERQPTPSPRPTRSRLSSVPNMFGDFFGGGSIQTLFQPPPQTIALDFSQFDMSLGAVPNGMIRPTNPTPMLPLRFDDVRALSPALPGGALPVVFTSATPLGMAVNQGQVFALNGGDSNYQNALLSIFGPTAVISAGQATANNGGTPNNFGDDTYMLNQSVTFIPAPVLVNIPPGGGAGVRRIKISENTSPQPRCRVFFNYNFFNDVIAGIGDVNRYTFGIEHCMADQTRSIEMRVPFASTLAADQTAGVQSKNTEWGNIVFVGKQVLFQNDQSLFSAGLGVAIPSGSDSRLYLPGGQQILHIKNNSVHLLPFIAAMSNPSDRWFWQGFVQMDVDVNGNPVRGDLTGRNLSQFGVLQDTALLFADLGVGYQLYQNPGAPVSAIAPMAELHYATTVENADFANGNGFIVRDFSNRFDVVNMTLGLNIFTRNGGSIRPGFVVPLRTGDNKQFDYEAQVQANMAY